MVVLLMNNVDKIEVLRKGEKWYLVHKQFQELSILDRDKAVEKAEKVAQKNKPSVLEIMARDGSHATATETYGISEEKVKKNGL